MDQFLTFVLALLVFAFFVFLIERSFKYVILLGFAIVAYFALLVLGVLG